jgi:tripartite-type tricarboxylate transporter receptor subunit TctC
MKRTLPYLQNKAARLLGLGAAVMMASGLACAPAQGAQNWPARPVTTIVAFTAGGTTDILAREIGNSLSQMWGQSVLVDNKPGASGNIGSQYVINAEPDGYTILMNSIGPIAVNPSLYKKMKFDPQKDLRAVALVAEVPNVLVVNPSSGIKSVKQLVEAMKKKPGQFNCASTGVGTAAHLSCETFAKMAGVKVVHIPYKGAGALTDLLGNRVQFMFATLPSVMGHLRSGDLTALAVSTTKRAGSLPDVPTVAESGYPNFALGSWFGYFAPKDTPDAIVNKINKDVNTVLNDPDIRTKLSQQGAEPIGGSADSFTKFVHTETIKWKKVVDDLGLSLD